MRAVRRVYYSSREPGLDAHPLRSSRSVHVCVKLANGALYPGKAARGHSNDDWEEWKRSSDTQQLVKKYIYSRETWELQCLVGWLLVCSNNPYPHCRDVGTGRIHAQMLIR